MIDRLYVDRCEVSAKWFHLDGELVDVATEWCATDAHVLHVHVLVTVRREADNQFGVLAFRHGEAL